MTPEQYSIYEKTEEANTKVAKSLRKDN